MKSNKIILDVANSISDSVHELKNCLYSSNESQYLVSVKRERLVRLVTALENQSTRLYVIGGTINDTAIVSRYSIMARFDKMFKPASNELLEVATANSIGSAICELERIKKNGGYDKAEIVRHDIAFVNGLSCGQVNEVVVNKWKRKGAKA